MLTSSLLAQPKIVASRANAQIPTSTFNTTAQQPSGKTAGFCTLAAPSSSRRLMAISAEGDKKNSGPVQKLQDVFRKHLQDLRAEVNSIKEEELAPYKEKVEELKSWAGEIENTTQTAAPGFLKPNASKNEAANAALDKAFISAMQVLTKDSESKPSVLILDSKSPFLARQNNLAASAQIFDDLPEKPVDAIVVDGLLHQPLKFVNEQVSKATVLLPAQARLVVVSQVNPDQEGAKVTDYVANLAKSTVTEPLSRALAVALEYRGFDIESSTQVDGVNTIIARKKEGVFAEISSNISKAFEDSVSRTTSQVQKIIKPNEESSAPTDSTIQ